MPAKQPVPSRDALRLLRNLAFSSPGAVAGVAGGVCCLAVIQYETRKRVALAERVLQTKRTIHSVSNGKGKAQVARMFEAAENGENFLLSPDNAQKRRQKRDYSRMATAVAKAESSGEGSEDYMDHWAFVSMNLPASSINELPHYDTFLFDGSNSDRKPVMAGDEFSTSAKNAQYPIFSQLQPEQLTTSEFQRVSVITESQRGKLRAGKRFGQGTIKSKGPKSARFGGEMYEPMQLNFRSPLIKRQPNQFRTSATSNPPRSPGLGGAPASHDPVQPFSDLSKIGGYSPGALLSRHDENKLNITPARPYEIMGQSSSVTDPPAVTLPSVSMNQTQSKASASRADVFSSKPEHSVSTGRNKGLKRMSSSPQAGDLQNMTQEDKYSTLYRRVHDPFRDGDVNKALMEYESTLFDLFSSRQSDDVEFAKKLHLGVNSQKIPASQVLDITQNLVTKLLSTEKPILESVALLYPQCGLGTMPSTNPYKRVQLYLRNFYEKNADTQIRVRQTKLIYDGSQMLGMATNDQIVLPLIQSLCKGGNVIDAEIILEEMSSEYGFESGCPLFAVLIKGYAMLHDWPRIDRILVRCHERGLSRNRIYGFSGLVAEAIEEYSRVKSPEQVYDFLTYSMHTLGMIPTTEVSNKAIQAFMRERRYDLVQTWIRERQVNYPDLSPSQATISGIFQFSCTWEQMGASAEDVFQTCVAFVTNAIRDPFCEEFRGIAVDAALKDMKSRLSKFSRNIGLPLDTSRLLSISDAKNAIGQVRQKVAELALDPQTKSQKFQHKLFLDDLTYQFAAIEQLLSLFRGFAPMTTARDMSRHSTNQSSKPQRAQDDFADEVRKTYPDISDLLTATTLPHPEELQKLIYEGYLTRQSHGLHPDHCILRYVVARLRRANMLQDALQLIENTHASPWTQSNTYGTPFDMELYMMWLHLATTIRDPQRIRSILWAIIDSEHQLNIPTRFWLLFNIAQLKSEDKRHRVISDAQVAESAYLLARLKRRDEEERTLLGKKEEKILGWKPMWRAHPRNVVASTASTNPVT